MPRGFVILSAAKDPRPGDEPPPGRGSFAALRMTYDRDAVLGEDGGFDPSRGCCHATCPSERLRTDPDAPGTAAGGRPRPRPDPGGRPPLRDDAAGGHGRRGDPD